MWSLADSELSDLSLSMYRLTVVTELMGKFDCNESLEGFYLRDIAELLEAEIKHAEGTIAKARPTGAVRTNESHIE